MVEALSQYDPAVIRTYKRILQAARASSSPAGANAIERAEFPKLWTAEAHLKAVAKFLEKTGNG